MDMIDNLCVSPRAASRAKSSTKVLGIDAKRVLSLPKSVVAAGGIEKWNSHPSLSQLQTMLRAACTATTVAEALVEIKGIMLLGHNLWAYAYLRTLGAVNPTIYYGLLAADPALLLPVAYTPTVGEACQKFGLMPFHPRGCYVSLEPRRVKAVLAEYAAAMLPRRPTARPSASASSSPTAAASSASKTSARGDGHPMGARPVHRAAASTRAARSR